MIKSERAFFDIIASCYQAAWDERLWSTALKNICNYTNSKSATFEAFDLKSGMPTHFYCTGIGEQQMADYVNYYCMVNPRHNYLLLTKEGHIGFDQQIFSENEMNHNEFYADLLRPVDLRYFLSSTLIKNRQRILILAPQRTPRQGHVDKHDAEKIKRISPFARQAFELGERIGSLRNERDGLRQILHDHELGLIIVDAGMKVHFINTKAQQLFRNDIGLKLISRRLEFNEPDRKREFEKLLSKALDHKFIDSSGRMLIRNNGANQVLILDITQLLAPENINDHLKLSDQQPYAIITLRDSQEQVGLTDQLLHNCYELTPRESQIARDLLQGMSFKQICQRDKVAITTVRTHYANLRAKIGAHNRAEVIHLLLPLTLQ